MTDQLVRALIETRLRNWADDNDLPVEWEDVGFTPPATAYIKFNLLPAQTRSDDLAGKFRTWSGVAQITICVPAGNGPAIASQYVAGLDALFPCSLNIASNPQADGIDLTVVVMTPVTARAGFADKAHWLVPADFQYRSDFVLP